MARKVAVQKVEQAQQEPVLKPLPAAVYAKAKPEAAAPAPKAEVKPVLVQDGNDDWVNAASAPVVTLDQILKSAGTIKSLGFNVLAGTFDQTLATKAWGAALKSEKSHFVKLVAVCAAHGREALVKAWNARQEAAKRKAEVSLSGLVKAAGDFGLVEKKAGAISPMTRLVDDLLSICNDAKSKDADKVKRIRARLEEVGQKD